MAQVNLDALILREDLEIKDSPILSTNSPGIPISSLKRGEMFFQTLRKPHFQRSTWDWTPQRVYNLIKSFTDKLFNLKYFSS